MFRPKYKEFSIEKLIELARENDYKALKELVVRKQNKIYLTFYYLCPDCDDLADLTQEALLRMCRGIKNLKNPKMFSGWLNRIISNLFCDRMRKKEKSPKCIPSDENCDEEIINQISDPCPSPDENTVNRETGDMVKEMISQLPENFRLVTVLREIAGLSYDEIAKITGTEVGTVKSRISRARGKLRQCLEPYFMTE